MNFDYDCVISKTYLDHYLFSQVYAYHFDQRAANNMWGEWMGVMHGDEITFAFGQPLRPELGFSDGDQRLSRRMMTLWANFAKTG